MTRPARSVPDADLLEVSHSSGGCWLVVVNCGRALVGETPLPTAPLIHQSHTQTIFTWEHAKMRILNNDLLGNTERYCHSYLVLDFAQTLKD